MFDFGKLFKSDKSVLVILAALLCYGLIFIYSATYRDQPSQYGMLIKQSIWVGMGLVILVFVAAIDLKKLKTYAYFIYGVNIFFLLLVYFIGKTAFGAQRWIPLGFFNFQPSEIGKLLIIISLAAFLSEKREKPYGPRDFIFAGIHVGIPILLVFGQPDLGTSLVFLVIFIGMLLFARFKTRYILFILFACVLAGFISIKMGVLSEYQMNRLLVFIDGDRDPLGAGYNLLQSQIAIGSGGLFGKGFKSGTQTGLDFLPNHETDFIFSVIGEEWGFVGSFLLIALFFLLFLRCLYIAITSRSKFGEIVIGGIVSMFFFQVVVNIGMTIGLMPITGVPLPFISYGGSAMITNLAIIGLLLNISSRRLEAI